MRLAALSLIATAALCQEGPTFSTGVSLVHADAEIVTAEGRTLSGFKKEDFRVFDQGKEQHILYFSEGQEPLDLILLFDVSGSMRPKVQEVADAAAEGMQELRTGDRIAIMAFNSRSWTVAPFTEDLAQVQRSIQERILTLPFRGATFIQSAIFHGAQDLLSERRTGRRRAILVITDNFGQRTKKESTVVRELWEADALLSGLIVTSKAAVTRTFAGAVMNPALFLATQVGIEGIAAKTGGDFIRAADPASMFRESMHRIRSRYTIYYAMPADAKPHSIRKVRIGLTPEAARRSANARVRARTGYTVPEETLTSKK